MSIGLRRSLALAVAVLAAGFVFVNGQRLLSVLYVQYSFELARSGNPVPAYANAVHAQPLAPWRTAAYRAELNSGTGRYAELTRASLTALRWSPGDPYLWSERARVLMAGNSFGYALAGTLRNIDELAPNSPQLHLINAWSGQVHWGRGNPEVRGYWLNSLRFVLKVSPRKYLRRLAKYGYAQQLCWGPGTQIPELDPWCSAQLRE